MPPHERSAMKFVPLNIFYAVGILFQVSIVRADFSEHIVMKPSVDKLHSKHHLTISISEKSDGFVDVVIPFIEGSMAYWLVTAEKQIPEGELNFRKFIWGGATPDYISSVVQLGSVKRRRQQKGAEKSIKFTVKQAILDRVYVYRDFAEPIWDGGYFYTYDLSKYKVAEQGVRE